MLRYHVKLSKDTNGTILVEVPDVPGAVTFGEDREEALLRAPDAIETVLIGYTTDRRDIPMPRAGAEGPFATLPALTEAKLALYTAMRTAKVGKAELARRLNCHMPQVDRLLDLRHASRLDQILDEHAGLLGIGGGRGSVRQSGDVFQGFCVVKHAQFSARNVGNIAELPIALAMEQFLCVPAAEGANHTESISRLPLNAKQYSLAHSLVPMSTASSPRSKS